MPKELYDKLDKAGAYINEIWQENQNNMADMAKLWERCSAFVNGNQQYVNSNAATAQISGSNFLVSQNQDNRNQIYITNEIEPIVRTLVSYMTRARPGVEVFPADDSEESKKRAEVGETILDAKYILDKEQDHSKAAAYNALTYGTTFRKDYWDYSIGANCEIPVFDELGNEVADPETGEVQTQVQKTGDNSVAILTPFTMGFDWSVTEWSNMPYLQEYYLMPVEWAREVFDRNEAGYTGKAPNIKEGTEIGASLTIFEQLKYATPFSYGTSTRTNTKDKTLVIETYICPNNDFPKGRMIIKAGGLTVYDSYNGGKDLGSPYFMPFQRPMWHPYSMFRYSPYIGRILGKGLVESLIPQQMRLNEINGAILTNANTMAKSDVLAIEGQLKRGVLNGAGGNVYTYKWVPGQPPPMKWQGAPLPAQFFQEKQQLIDQMVREAGTNFVMQGQPPTGVTASSAISQLLENANAQQSDMMISWEGFHEQGWTNKLRIIRNFCMYPHDELVDYIRTMDRDALDQDIDGFTGEDLGDGLTLRIEAGSMIPESNASKRDLYIQLAEGPFAQFLQEDSPRGEKIRKEFLEKLGEKAFDTQNSIDEEKAEWENMRMMKGLPVEVFPGDNDAIHIDVLLDKMKDPKFLERASNQVKMAYQTHLTAHQQAASQKQQQAQQQAMQQEIQQAHIQASVNPGERGTPQPLGSAPPLAGGPAPGLPPHGSPQHHAPQRAKHAAPKPPSKNDKAPLGQLPGLAPPPGLGMSAPGGPVG